MSKLNELIEMIQKGDLTTTEKLVKELFHNGTSPQKIIQEALTVALEIVGKKFSSGEAFIPEMLIAARASQKCLEILRPRIIKTVENSKGKVVIGTVKGDLHDIGKNIVSMVLEANGFEIIDLGIDVSPEQFIDAIKEHNADILALSCLLTTTMPSMNQTIKKLEADGIRNKVKVMIGGPPTSIRFAEEIGADYYGKDAYIAVGIAKKIASDTGLFRYS
jgi:5-methyltetrahydrofolate--homocysteine methyltransferase